MTIYWSRILEAWHILDGRPPGREQVTLGNAICIFVLCVTFSLENGLRSTPKANCCGLMPREPTAWKIRQNDYSLKGVPVYAMLITTFHRNLNE